MRRTIWIILTLMMLGALAVAAPGAAGSAQTRAAECIPKWTLAFEDEFSGSEVDTTKWDMYYSPGHAGNGLRRPSAFSVANGMLTITAEIRDGQVVSGGMKSLSTRTYGRFEARVRTAEDPSETMSGVVIAWPDEQGGDDGGYTEIDFYETGYTSRSPLYFFLHYDVPNNPDRPRFSAPVDATQWHDVRMDWTESEVAWYVDGEFIGRSTDPATIPRANHSMTVQLDAFGEALGAPVTMDVDYARIYDYDPSGVEDCQQVPVIETPVAGSKLDCEAVPLTWTDTADEYWVFAGSSLGGRQYYNSQSIGDASGHTMTGIPSGNSRTIYVRLWSRQTGGTWSWTDTTFVGCDEAPVPVIESPASGTVLECGDIAASWTDTADEYWIYAGPTIGSLNYYNSKSIGDTSTHVIPGIPDNAGPVFVRLWSRHAGSSWGWTDVEYSTCAPLQTIMIDSPAAGSQLPCESTVLSWTASFDEYWVYAGSTVGGYEYHNSKLLGAVSSHRITGLPSESSLVTVRVWGRSGDAAWVWTDVAYLACPR